MYSIIYTAFYGNSEIIGSYDSFEKAKSYMKTDVEYNIVNASNYGVEYLAEEVNDRVTIIPEYGKWEIAENY